MAKRLACVVMGLAWLSAGCGDDSGTGGSGGGGGGGGPNADPLEVRWTSGSRLKIKVQRAADAEQFAGVHDVELDSTCVILPAGDGSLRCVPSGQARVVYTDAECTNAVATYYPPECGDTGPGTYATLSGEIDLCTYTSDLRAFEVGEPVADADIYELDGTGTCTATGAVTPLYALGPELDPEAMVAIEVVDAPRGDALGVQYFHSEDGFYLLGDYPLDSARATACFPSGVGAAARCVPNGLYATSSVYSDAACAEQGVFSGLPAGCTQPAFGSLTITDGCESETKIYEVGEMLTATYVETQPGTCVSSPGMPANPYALGAEVPITDLPAVDPVEEGEGAVRFSTYQAEGLPITRNGSFVTGDGGLCFAYAFGDGTVRCGPPTLGYVAADPNRYYADSACTDALVPSYGGDCAGSEPNRAVVAPNEPGACVLTDGVYEIGAPHNGSVFVNSLTDGCIESTPADVSFRQLGDRIPDEEFVEVTIETL